MPNSNVMMAKHAAAMGFTGTQKGMTSRQEIVFIEELGIFKYLHLISGEYVEFHHGDCIGADVQAAERAYALDFYIICHPPEDEKKRGFFRKNDIILPPDQYMVRNFNIVNACDVLIATPYESREYERSGTWATIREARRVKKPIVIILPDGKRVVEAGA